MEKLIHNVSTNEIFFENYTDAEIAEIEKERKENQIKTAELDKQMAELRAAKSALLEKLGITEDEAKLLLS